MGQRNPKRRSKHKVIDGGCDYMTIQQLAKCHQTPTTSRASTPSIGGQDEATADYDLGPLDHAAFDPAELDTVISEDREMVSRPFPPKISKDAAARVPRHFELVKEDLANRKYGLGGDESVNDEIRNTVQPLMIGDKDSGLSLALSSIESQRTESEVTLA